MPLRWIDLVVITFSNILLKADNEFGTGAYCQTGNSKLLTDIFLVCCLFDTKKCLAKIGGKVDEAVNGLCLRMC